MTPDTVRLRWLTVEPADQARWRGLLNAQEIARADRFRFAADRDAYTAAHALARLVLSEATGQSPTALRFVDGASGKPGLADGRLQLSITHTRGFVACAVAHEAVGVDAEVSDHATDVLATAERFFAPEEIQLLHASPPEERTRLFFRLWTLKEAFVKATGEGLRRNLDSFSYNFDPPRIVFHQKREDDPALWIFAEFTPAPNRPLAIAARRAGATPLRVDARAL